MSVLRPPLKESPEGGKVSPGSAGITLPWYGKELLEAPEEYGKVEAIITR